MTLAAPTVYTDLVSTLSSRTLSWGPFTAAVGDLLVIKAANEDVASGDRFLAPSATSGGITWTKQDENIASGHTYGVIYTGVVTTAPTGGQLTVTMAQNGGASTLHGGVLEQWPGGKVAASPAVATANGSGAPTGSITSTVNGSQISALNGDWAAADGSTRAYRSSGVEQGYLRDTGGARATLYFWRQPADTAGAQTIGLSAPSGQTYSMLAIEIQDASAPAPQTDAVYAGGVVGNDSLATAGTTIATVIPATVSAGDCLLACRAVAQSQLASIDATHFTPSGWTEIGRSSGGTLNGMILLYKVATAGDIGSTVNWTLPSGYHQSVAIVGYHGGDPNDPIDQAGFAVDGSTRTAHPLAQVNAGVANAVPVFFVTERASGTASTWTAPTSGTLRGSTRATAASQNSSVAIADRGDYALFVGQQTPSGSFTGTASVANAITAVVTLAPGPAGAAGGATLSLIASGSAGSPALANVRAHANNYTTTGGATQSVAIPGSPKAGDPVGVWITGNDNTLALQIYPTGWTLEYATSVGTGFRAFLHKVYDPSDGAAVSLTFNKQPTMSTVVAVFDGAFHSGFGTIGTVFTRATASTDTTAPAAGSTAAPNLVVFHEKTTSQTSCSVFGVNGAIENVLPPSGVAGSLFVGWYDTTSGTDDVTASYSGTANTNGVGYQVPLLPAAAATAPAAGAAAITLTAAGAGSAPVTGTAALSLSAAGAGRAPAGGAAALTLTAAGTGRAPDAGTAALTLAAAGAAASPTSGAAALALTATGTVDGALPATGTAGIALTAAGTVGGRATGTAGINLAAAGSASATNVTAVAALDLNASGAGGAPIGSSATLELTAAGDAGEFDGTAAVTVRASASYYVTAGGDDQVVAFPGSPQEGDPIGIWVTLNDQTITIPTAPAGWTLEYDEPVGTGMRAFLHKLYDVGDGTSVIVSFSKQPNGSFAAVTFDGSVHSGFGPVGTITTRPSASNNATAVKTGSSAAPNLVVFHEKTTGQTACTVSAVAAIENRLPPAGFAGSVYVGSYDDSSGTADKTAVYGGAANANAAGYQVPMLLKAATPVQKWLATTPWYIARGGGSGDWPEYTLYAYAHAAAWNSGMALEVSTWQTTDGVWVCSHDQTTGADYGTNLTITSSTWADLSALRTTVGGQPMAKLVDMLNAYAVGDRVIFIDNKGQTTPSALLDLLDAHGGAGRFVSKGFCTSTTMADAATARGYQTWGYYYDADVATNLPNTQSHWSLLGMDYTASSADWTAVKSYGKPVIGHIIPTAAARATAFGFGAAGIMASGVVEAVPNDTPAGGASLSLVAAGAAMDLPTPDPDAAYAFDEGVGTTFADSTGNGHNGTLVDTAGTGALTWVAGGANGSPAQLRNQDGASNAYGSIPRSAGLEPADSFTIMAWADMDNASHSYQLLFGKSRVGLNDSIAFYTTGGAGGNIPIVTIATTDGIFTATAPAAYTAGTPFHCCIRYDGALLEMLINSTVVASVPATGDIVYDDTQPWSVLGSSAFPNEGAPGDIDDLRFYVGSKLTDNQVQTLARTAVQGAVTATATGAAAISLTAAGTALAVVLGQALIGLNAAGAASAPAAGSSVLTLAASGMAAVPVAGGAVLTLHAAGQADAVVGGQAMLTEAVDGPGLSRAVFGPAARVVQTVVGIGLSRRVNGPGLSRTINGLGR